MELIQDGYRSYLLRMWRVQVDEGIDWRASLEEVQTGEMHGFPDLAALIGYLESLSCKESEDEAVLEQRPD